MSGIVERLRARARALYETMDEVWYCGDCADEVEVCADTLTCASCGGSSVSERLDTDQQRGHAREATREDCGGWMLRAADTIERLERERDEAQAEVERERAATRAMLGELAIYRAHEAVIAETQRSASTGGESEAT